MYTIWDGENILEFVFNTLDFTFLAFSSKFSKFFYENDWTMYDFILSVEDKFTIKINSV